MGVGAPRLSLKIAPKYRILIHLHLNRSMKEVDEAWVWKSSLGGQHELGKALCFGKGKGLALGKANKILWKRFFWPWSKHQVILYICWTKGCCCYSACRFLLFSGCFPPSTFWFFYWFAYWFAFWFWCFKSSKFCIDFIPSKFISKILILGALKSIILILINMGCSGSVRNCFRAGDDQLEIGKAAGELSQEKKDAFLIVNTRTTPDEQNKQRSNLLAFFPKRPELGFNRGMVNAIRSRGPMTSFNASGQTAKAARVKEMYHTLSPYMRELFLRCWCVRFGGTSFKGNSSWNWGFGGTMVRSQWRPSKSTVQNCKATHQKQSSDMTTKRSRLMFWQDIFTPKDFKYSVLDSILRGVLINQKATAPLGSRRTWMECRRCTQVT